MNTTENTISDSTNQICNGFEYLVSKIDVPQFIKDKILSDAFNNHKFYLLLPFELSKIYPTNMDKNEKIMQLTFYSYLYFASFLSFDKYYDDQTENVGYKEYLKYYIFYIKETALLGLTKLLGVNDKFWNDFINLKDQYFNSTTKCQNINYKELDFDIYSQIAKDKSIMSYAYVYALDSLFGISDNSARILKALDTFHLGFQINDDYKDMKEDFRNSQINYFHWQIAIKNNIELTEQNYSNYLKRAYIDGTITLGLQESVKYLDNAIKEIEGLGLNNIEKTINELIFNSKGELHYISATIQKTIDRASKSNIKVTKNSLPQAIVLASDFLIKNIKGTVWVDFITNAGYGKEWITGYIICMFGEIDNRINSFETSLDWLTEKGGGYSSEIVKDADSINFLIKALSIFNKEIPDELIKSWLAFSNDNGGWATYYDEGIKLCMRMPLDSDFSGWYNPQLCVTAVSAWVLKDIHYSIVSKKYNATLDYLEKRQNVDGSWNSYWWTENIYATAYCILAFPKTEQYFDLLQKGVEYLLSKQSGNGAWLNNEQTSAFYTALSIKAIMDYNLYYKNENLNLPIDKGISWLLLNQNIDGSWDVNRILRLPSPEVHNPNDVLEWGRTSFGLNCLVDDHNRVFSTSTIYNVLSLYGNKFK